MFAIISTGGKQYKVSQDTVLTVNKLEGKDGDKITINEIKEIINSILKEKDEKK